MSSTDEPTEVAPASSLEDVAEPSDAAPLELSVEDDDLLLVSSALDVPSSEDVEAKRLAKMASDEKRMVDAAERKALRFAIPDLDKAMSPIRRLSNWASDRPTLRARQIRFLEAVVQRWVEAALALQLPEAILESVRNIGQTVEGYDSAEVVDRAPMLMAFGQHMTRLDTTLGFPLRDVRLRIPRKPRFRQRPEVVPVEDVQAPAPAPDSKPPGSGNSVGSTSSRSDGGRAARRGRGRSRQSPRRVVEEAPVEPLLPFWNGRPSASIADLRLDPHWVEALLDSGIETVGDLLWTAPQNVQVIHTIHGAGRELPEGRIAVGGRVQQRWTVIRPDGHQIPMVRLKGADVLDVDFDGNQEALEAAGGLESLVLDQRVVLVGERRSRGESVGLIGAEIAFENEKKIGLRNYEITGLRESVMRAIVGRVLPLVGQLRDPIPTSALIKQGLAPLKSTVVDLHHGDFEVARKRLAFDEALALQAGLAAPRHARENDRGQPLAILHGLASLITQAYDLLLNDEQQTAFEDIKRDLRSRLPMRRVLTGDIGCGRTQVVMLTTASVAEGKSQVLHMCADAVSAEQRFLFAAPLLKEGGLVARLIQEEPSKAMRDAISRGEVHVVFGTVGLMKADLAFRRLGLVVAEERGTYGRVGEWLSQRRPPRSHALFVPPVPVGATLSLTAFADCDISCIQANESDKVQVSAVPATSRDSVYERAGEVVAGNRQVIVMFPMVKGTDALDLRSAVGVVRSLEGDALKGCRVGLFHSQMPPDERLRAYSDFMRRRYDVLLATGPVEDAPEVPGVAMVVVEQADRVDA
ncbi:MAG: hypothetical protein GWP91_05310, partial [Rhodobacterales bacterium]|nr:hypothetical protein [Rhodobacterales bacterium]